jgi:DNA-binding MarR family transcriptional regulator
MTSEREMRCLMAMDDLHRDSHWGYDGAHYFRAIAEEARLDERQVRRAVRSLARQGLVWHVRGLFDEEGQVAGSGYALTDAGRLRASLRREIEDQRASQRDHAAAIGDQAT